MTPIVFYLSLSPVVTDPPLVEGKTNFGRVVFSNLQLKPASRSTDKASEGDRAHGQSTLFNTGVFVNSGVSTML